VNPSPTIPSPSRPPRLEPWLVAGALAGDTPRVPATAGERLALARALKDACYEAWSTAPARATVAADALAALARAAPEAEVVALADWCAAIAALSRGAMDDAIDALERARDAFERLGKPAIAAQTEVPRMMALAMLGRHDEALRRARDAQAVLVREGDLRTAGKLGINLGSMHLRRDEYAEAVHHYRAAGVLTARVGDRESSIMCDIGRADALTWLGDLDEAQRLYDRARMRARMHGLPVLEALVDGNAGWLELSRGRHPEALRALESACRRYRELALPQRLAIAEQHLGDAYLETGLLPEAIALYDAAIAAFTGQDAPEDLAWTQSQLGRAWTLVGDDARATAAFGAASRLYALQGNRAGGGVVTLWQAELAQRQGARALASTLAADAQAVLADAGMLRWHCEARVVAAEAALDVGDARAAADGFTAAMEALPGHDIGGLRARCLVGLGHADRFAGRPDDARIRYADAIRHVELRRAALPGGEWRVAYQAEVRRPYEAMLALVLDTPGPRQAIETLALTERCRGRALLDGTDEAPVPDPAVDGLRDRVRWMLHRAGRADASPDEARGLRERLGVLERELLEVLRRRALSGDGAVAPAATHADAPETPPSIGAPLDEDTVVVEYGESRGELYACTLSAEGVRLWRDLARGADWAEAVRRVRFQIDTLKHGAGRLDAHACTLVERARTRLVELHALIWAPIAGALEGRRRVVVIPQGALHGVPFAALHDGERHVVEGLDVCTAPSLALARRAWTRRVGAPRRACALGVGGSLPHTADEARRVGAHFAGAKVLVGADATGVALRALAPDADLLHIACHATFRADSPMFSTLHLADGPLSLLDLRSVAFAPSLVVLSGCETGRGAVARGEDLIGLVQTLIGGGAVRVVASHWPVDDAASRELMASFYRGIAGGSTPSAALAQAQRASIARGAHPFHWAAFAVHGGQ